MNIKDKTKKLITPEDAGKIDDDKSHAGLDATLKAEWNMRLQYALNDPKPKKQAERMRKINDATGRNGFNPTKTKRHIAEIPVMVMIAAKAKYGDRIFKEPKLFRHLFEPWITVDPKTIGGNSWKVER